jgi:hypothetical protein
MSQKHIIFSFRNVSYNHCAIKTHVGIAVQMFGATGTPKYEITDRYEWLVLLPSRFNPQQEVPNRLLTE